MPRFTVRGSALVEFEVEIVAKTGADAETLVTGVMQIVPAMPEAAPGDFEVLSDQITSFDDLEITD